MADLLEDLNFNRLTLDDGTIRVYCGGSAPLNGREGATAAYACVFPNHEEHNQAEPIVENGTTPTNQRAILHAAIAALAISRSIDQDAPLQVISNSKYLNDAMNEYVAKWVLNGWRKSNKRPVENQDLLKALVVAADGRDIKWLHVEKKREEQSEEQRKFLTQALRAAQRAAQRVAPAP
ncbi:hypothetical protein ATCC90586_003782 [Pythium insidiosum]|nr:hypothetical protein ATCC90586_003782 [Pythium insidiosum]